MRQNHKFFFVLFLMTAVNLSVAGRATAQTISNTFDYWLMPQDLVQTFDGTAAGQKSFWRGVISGKTVALQGDPSSTRYDVFVDEGTRLTYWSTFLGNGYPPVGDNSHAFQSPYTFLNKTMVVNDDVNGVIEQTITDQSYSAQLRKNVSQTPWTFRTKINALYPTWQDPNSGIIWSDVLKITFWPRYNPADENISQEAYWLARGQGWVHYFSPDPTTGGEAWVTSSHTESQRDVVDFAWYDPFNNTSFVPNGFFEDYTSSQCTGQIASVLRSWTASNSNGVITTDGSIPPDAPGGTGPCKIAMTGGGAGVTVAKPVNCIPVTAVTPAATYRLSGWIWRVSAQDNAYLDFNDGVACLGGNFTETSQAIATSTNTWEFVEATVAVGSTTTGL